MIETIHELAARELFALLRRDWLSFRLSLLQNLARLGRSLDHNHGSLPRGGLSGFVLGLLPISNPPEEIKQLVDASFADSIAPTPRGSWGLATGEQRTRWNAVHLLPPKPAFSDAIRKGFDAGYVLGGLSEAEQTRRTLQSLLEERKLLSFGPLDAVHTNATQVALRDAAVNITNYGAHVAGSAAEAALDIERQITSELVARHLAGLTPSGLSWKDLGRELYKRMKATNATRDWDRVAASEMRRAINIGKLLYFYDKKFVYVEAVLQNNACSFCKLLYLNPDGTSKRFRVVELLANVLRTGGMNKGLTSAKIGTEGGWMPNALVHPWCQCFFIVSLNQQD